MEHAHIPVQVVFKFPNTDCTPALAYRPDGPKLNSEILQVSKAFLECLGGRMEAQLMRWSTETPEQEVELFLNSRYEFEALYMLILRDGRALTQRQRRQLVKLSHQDLPGLTKLIAHLPLGSCANCGLSLSVENLKGTCLPRVRSLSHCGVPHCRHCGVTQGACRCSWSLSGLGHQLLDDEDGKDDPFSSQRL